MANRILRGAACFCGIAWVTSVALAEPFEISCEAMPRILLESGLRPFVEKAATDVADDLERMFGTRPDVQVGLPSAEIENAIVLTKQGDGFEMYGLRSESRNRLRITGSDDRGVMFGLYRFASDFLNVDPFWWFARGADGSSPSHARRERMYWPNISLVQGEPSFRYRAWFVNDEDFLNGFLPEENGRREIDYQRYSVCFGETIADRLYEAAARAGFNTMICASYVDILNPDERRLLDIASRRGFYLTMHHQEPVGAAALMLDVHFPEMRGTTYASHPGLWRKAWRRYVTEWSKYPDVIFQVGLRGRKDKPFWLLDKHSFHEKGAVTREETLRRAALISSAMREQYEMIREIGGVDRPQVATQLWAEGADFYRQGLLEVPEGTIVIFSDNSPGLKFQPDLGGIDRLPAGGHYGIYYHLAIVEGNHRCEIVPPKRTHEILLDAHRKGAEDLLLVNVSNVRPFLYTIAGTCEMARDLRVFDAETFSRRWCAERFGDGAEIAKRAIDLYFAGLEVEFSRDAVSAYGSPRGRAVLPLFNDGVVYRELSTLLRRQERCSNAVREDVGDPSSPYEADPDELAPVSEDQNSQVSQDMRPFFRQRTRLGPRAAAQVAGLARCIDACELAGRRMTETEREIFFQRVVYQASFLSLACASLSEVSLGTDAGRLGAQDACRRHLSSALKSSCEREVLDKRYASGVWQRWYDRDLIYPYSNLSALIRKRLDETNQR